jgi:divalent metal cation (Fe/Co/Zn/Cd) transporter
MIHLNHGLFLFWGNNYLERVFFSVSDEKCRNDSSSLKDAWHHRSDAITSVAALLEFLCSIVRKGYESADDWAALFASGFICLMLILFLDPHLVK